MIKVNQATARCMVRLNAADEFQQFRAWLTDSLIDTDLRLRDADGIALSRLQGKAQCLESILEKLDQAREIDARHEKIK